MILIIIGYSVCSALTWMIAFNYFQNKWPSLAEEERNKDARARAQLSIFGPASLIVLITYLTLEGDWEYIFMRKSK